MSSYSHSTNKALNSNTNFFQGFGSASSISREWERKNKNKKTRAREGEREEKKERENKKEKEGGFRRPYFQAKCDRIALPWVTPLEMAWFLGSEQALWQV